MAITSANQLELLQTAEAVAREKMIDPGLVVEAMEESLARAAKSRYGAEMDIRVSIDRKTGRARFTRVRTVVEDEDLENYQAEFTVEQARQYMDDPKVGDTFEEEVPPVALGRYARTERDAAGQLVGDGAAVRRACLHRLLALPGTNPRRRGALRGLPKSRGLAGS